MVLPVVESLRQAGLPVGGVHAPSLDALGKELSQGADVVVATDEPEPKLFDVLAAVRARRELVPFIAVLGHADERHAVELMRAGANDVVPRYDLSRLGPVVRRELRETSTRREHQRELRLIAQTQALARVGGFEHCLRTQAVFWTQELYRLTGRSPDRFQPSSTSLYDTAAPEYAVPLRDAVQRAFATGNDFQLDYELLLPNAGRRWVRVTGGLERESGVPVRLVGAIMDIAERKNVEAGLLLKDRLSSLGSLAASVAHEINNPLAFVVANLPEITQRLQAAAQGSPGSAQDVWRELEPLLADCAVGTERIRSIVSDLRVFSRAEEVAPRGVDLLPVVQSVVRMASNTARFRAKVVVDVPPLPPVLAVESRLAQVLTNLLVNALQSFAADQPVTQNTVTLSARPGPAGFVTVEVRDSGRGIPPEVLPRIFDPFFTTKPLGEGTGLGLSVCRSVVESAGGRLEVDSVVGQGSTFRLVWPQAPQSERLATPQPMPAMPRPERRRLLVVDDEPKLGRAIARMLKGFDVDVAVGGEEALSLVAQAKPYDAVLCDVMMPDMTGMELFAALTQRAPALAKRCVFMTGGSFTPEAKAFVDGLPRYRCVEKPFAPDVVHAALERALAASAP